MKRGTYLHCIGAPPALYLTLQVIDTGLVIAGLIILVLVLIVAAVNAFRKQPILTNNYKKMLVVLVSAIIYFGVRLYCLSVILPKYTSYSDSSFYTLCYIWLSIVIFIDLIIIKRYFSTKSNLFTTLFTILGIVLLLTGIVATVLKINELSKPEPAVKTQAQGAFNPYLPVDASLWGCSGFKWY